MNLDHTLTWVLADVGLVGLVMPSLAVLRMTHATHRFWLLAVALPFVVFVALFVGLISAAD